MPPAIKPSIPKGTRDFLPDQMVKRQFVVDTIKSVFEQYGYEPLETPSIEKLDVLSGKYGDEGEKLIFKVLRRGTGLEGLLKGEKPFVVQEYGQLVEEALRYDLTVPLSRVVAMYQNQLTFPFRRYQIQPVWRADRPQRGRYREFYQCDVDLVGTESVLADAETIAIVHAVLTTLGFDNFTIRLNNRKILNGILEVLKMDATAGTALFVALDKLDKIGVDGVKQELQKQGFPANNIQDLFEIIAITGSANEVLQALLTKFGDVSVFRAGAEELQQIVGYLQTLDVDEKYYLVDMSLVRGLGYYTGPIHESVVTEPKIGSLTGGGRYDRLIGMFLGRDIPATGTAFGIERIIDVMDQLQMFPDSKTRTEILVTTFDETTLSASVKIANELRKQGLRVQSVLEVSKLKKQFSYADKKGIPFVVLIGPEELAQNLVTVKNLSTGEQERLPIENIAKVVRKNTQIARSLETK